MRIVAIYRRRHVDCRCLRRHHAHRAGRRGVRAGRHHADPPRARLAAARGRPVKRVMIAGGGRVGLRLAREISRPVPGEADRGQAARAASTWRPQLPADMLVLKGDCTDEDLLGDENVRRDGPVPRADQRRRGQHHGLPAGQADGRAPRARADQPQGLCRPGAGHADRHRAVAGAGGDRRAARHVRRGRRRGGAQPAPRRGRGAGGGGARRPQDLARWSGRRIDELGLPEGAQIGAIVRARSDADETQRGDHPAPRHGDPDRRPRDRVRAAQAHGARHREAVPGRRDVRSDALAPRMRLRASPSCPALCSGAARVATVRAALHAACRSAFAWCRSRRRRSIAVRRCSADAPSCHAGRAAWRRDEPGRAALQARAAAARRLPAGEPDLDAAACLRRAAADAGAAGPERDRRVLRGDVGLHRHRRHGAHRARPAAAVGQRVALLPATGRRPGHRRAGGGGAAAAGRRRHAAVPGRDRRGR